MFILLSSGDQSRERKAKRARQRAQKRQFHVPTVIGSQAPVLAPITPVTERKRSLQHFPRRLYLVTTAQQLANETRRRRDRRVDGHQHSRRQLPPGH